LWKEGQNIEKFRENFADEKNVSFPEVFYSSQEKTDVLVVEF
jgi:predicted unusual protein kinase regulating ubiquinone biosynthesis (AarF/ABC1/UbiB family)